jgi:tRNA uridine 5-carbamoylmethylation protein Kti12
MSGPSVDLQTSSVSVIDVWYISFDAAERALAATQTSPTSSADPTAVDISFDPALWKNARKMVEDFVESFLKEPENAPPFDATFMKRRRMECPAIASPPGNLSTLILLDDNFYYQSMRRVFQQTARRHNSCYGEVVVAAPLELALQRNSQRTGANRVPKEVLLRMSSRFENVDMTTDYSTLEYSNDKDTALPLDVTPMWNIISAAGKRPLTMLYTPIDLVAQQIDREATSKSILHQLDMAIRDAVSEEMKVRGKVEGGALMRAGLGKYLSGIKRSILSQWRARMDASPSVLSSTAIMASTILEIHDECDLFAWRTLQTLPEGTPTHVLQHVQQLAALLAVTQTDSCVTTDISSLHQSVARETCTKELSKSLLKNLSQVTRDQAYRNATGTSVVVLFITEIFVSVSESFKGRGDGAFALGVAEISLFEIMTDLTRCLRNCCAGNSGHQHRIRRNGGLQTALDIVQDAATGWDREGSGALYLTTRDLLLRTVMQFVTNSIARNDINQAWTFRQLFPMPITRLIKDGHQNDRKILSISTMLLWYCVAQWKECLSVPTEMVGSLQRLRKLMGVKEQREESSTTSRSEDVQQCLSTLLKSTTSSSDNAVALEADAALDGVDFLVRAFLSANGMRHIVRLIESVSNVKAAVQFSITRPLVEVSEVVLYHFLQRHVEDKDTIKTWTSEMAAVVSQKVQILIEGGAERATQLLLQQTAEHKQKTSDDDDTSTINIDAKMIASLEMLSAWTLLESEALEVLLTVASAMLTKGNPDVQFELCGGGTLLRVVLSELARLQKTPTGNVAKKDTNTPKKIKKKKKKKLPVRKGIKTVLMQLVANFCAVSPHMKDRVRELGGIPIVINCCTSDRTHPMLREFAFFAVRNLCEDNAENQRAIDALQPQGKIVREGQVGPGLSAKIGEDGKVTLTKSS